MFLLSALSADAQTSTLIGGRSAGVGYASAALVDEWALFNNVGAIGRLRQASAAFSYEVRPALVGANRMAASILSPSKLGTLGIGVYKFGDDMYSEQMVSVGFGNSIGTTSLSFKTNYLQYKAAESFGTNSAVTFEFGGLSKITPQLSVGAYITNLTQSKLTTGERLPTRLVIGVGFTPSEKIFISTEIEKDLDFQVTWRSGLEYAIYRKVFFRTGFNRNPDAAYFGLGFHKKNLKLDFASRFNQLTGPAHQASATYLFSSRTRK